jgi:sodium/proline symporter
MSAVVALVAHEYFGNTVTDSNQTLVFVMLARNLVPGLFAGILISAIIAASMSTADSQLLASSSAFASDIYKAQIKKDATDKQMLVVGRVVVCVVSVVALAIALMPGTGGIMGLVSNAWSIFGSSFGPAIILSLYFRKFNYKGAVAGIITGFAVSVLWLIFLSGVTGLYEIIPGFISSLLVSIIVSKCTKEPEEEVVKLFDEVKLLNSKNFDN